MKNGFQAQATYTGARAPTTGRSPAPTSWQQRRPASDPTNIDRDKGVTPFNQTHTLAVSDACYAPQVSGDGMGAKLANNNQLASSPGEQRPAVQHPLEPRPERRRRAATIGRWASSATPGVSALCSTSTCAIRASSRFGASPGRRSSSRPRTSSTARTSSTSTGSSPPTRRAIRSWTSATRRPPARGLPFSGTAGYDQRITQIGFKVTF